MRLKIFEQMPLHVVKSSSFHATFAQKKVDCRGHSCQTIVTRSCRVVVWVVHLKKESINLRRRRGALSLETILVAREILRLAYNLSSG